MTQELISQQPATPNPPAPIQPGVFDEEGRRIVRPDVLNFITLSTIAAHAAKQTKLLQKLYDHEKDLEGDGLTRYIPLTVTDKQENYLLPEVWQSCSITNDGDNMVYIKVNTPYADEIPLNQSETLNQDTKTHKLKRLYLRCDTGKTSSIRILGIY